MSDRLDRRDFIEAALASGGIVMVAGCGGQGGDGGDGGDGGGTPTGDGGNGDGTPTGDGGDGGDGGGEGTPVEVTLLNWTQYPTHQSVTEFFIPDLEELGFSVSVESRELGQAIQAQANKEEWFQLAFIAWGSSPVRLSHWYLTTLHHSSEAGEGGFNMSGIQNDELDSLIDQQATEFDQDRREELIKQAQQKILDLHTDYVFTFRPLVYAYNQNKWENATVTSGVGMGKPGAYWSHIDMTPTTDDTTLVVGSRQGIGDLNTMDVQNTTQDGLFNMAYDSLLKNDANFETIGWLAEDWQTDGTTITLDMRPGVTWHDGEDLTAQDAAFSYQLAIDEEFPGYGRGRELIESVKAVDDMTLEFELSETYAPFVSRTLTYGPILPEHIWSDVNPRQFQNKEMIGSGPWIFEDWEAGDQISFTANEDHFYPPGADRLVFVQVGSNSAMIRAVNNKEIDITGRSIGIQAKQQVEGRDHLEVLTVQSFGSFTIHPHVFQKPFDDVEVRRAVHHALNRELASELQNNEAMPAKGTVLHPDLFGSAHGELDYPQYDLDKARQILSDAGYWWDDNGQLMYPQS